jgi:hypothetical protein
MHHVIGMARTVQGSTGPKAVFKLVPAEGVLEAVLEFVHPSNLGTLPPSPDVLIAKAITLGLVSSVSDATVEVCVWRSHHTKEQDAAMMADLRKKFHCI